MNPSKPSLPNSFTCSSPVLHISGISTLPNLDSPPQNSPGTNPHPLNHCDSHLPTPKMDLTPLCYLKLFQVSAANRSKPIPPLGKHSLPSPLCLGPLSSHPSWPKSPQFLLLQTRHSQDTLCSFLPRFLHKGSSLCLKYSMFMAPSKPLPMST